MTPTPHLVLTLGRSGSNFLVNAINRAEGAVNFGEVLGGWTAPWRFYDRLGRTGEPARYQDAFYDDRARYYAMMAGGNAARLRAKRPLSAPRRSSLATIGTKDFSLVFRDRGIADYAGGRDDLLVIGLVRENLVRRAVSGQIMRWTGLAASTEAIDLPKVAVDVDAFEKQVALYAAELRELRAQLARVPSERRLDLTYEELFENPDATTRHLARTYDFLGLRYDGQTSDHKRLNARPLQSAIANFDELRERLGGTPYEEQLLRD